MKHCGSLKRNAQPVPSVDLGAGSTGDISTVAAVANRSLKRPKHARALAALSQHIQCKKALELGTSLGITSAYIAAHVEQLVTVEGNPHLAELAQENWNTLGITNIESIVGNFDAHGTPSRASSTYDLIFIDGNHKGCASTLHRKWLGHAQSGWRYRVRRHPLVQGHGRRMAAICAKDCWTLQMDAFE